MMNDVELVGVVKTDAEFNHEMFGEKFYIIYVETVRMSDTSDVIPVMVSERLMGDVDISVGAVVLVEGQFRSHNIYSDGSKRLFLSVFAQSIFNTEYNDYNSIALQGYVCKPVNFRRTPMGREIADLCLAVNRPYGKSDYIPCIAWGRNAKYIADLAVGTELVVYGRIQSRNYTKVDGDTAETRTAYEVSANKILIVDNDVA